MLTRTLLIFLVTILNVAKCSLKIVTNYKLVPVHHHGLINETHAHEHDLKLKSIDSILFGTNTKVWTASYDKAREEVQYTPVENALEKAYQDPLKEIEGNSSITNEKPSVTKKSVYPKILVVVDSQLHTLIGSNNASTTLKYVVSFMNGVDMRFKYLEDPRVQLHVAGVIVAQEQDATPYEEVFDVVDDPDDDTGVSAINDNSTLSKMADYFYNQRLMPKSNFDVVLLLTGYDMCSLDPKTDECSLSTGGVAYTGGLCYSIVNHFGGSGIVKDNGNYEGMLSAVHELGHLFNVSHDGKRNSAQCTGNDGFLMSRFLSDSPNNRYWSPCSIRAMKDFFNSDKAFCVSEKPVTGEIIHSSDELQYLKMQRERNEPYTILNRNNETYTTIYNIIE